jgi:hypothetical protein
MTQRRLRDAAEVADADRFVARESELRIARDVLDDVTPSRVLYVHGPGGIGKSALLRAVGRLATGAGVALVALDARATPEEFDREIAGVLDAPVVPTLVVVDEADLLGSRLAAVRDRLLDALPDTCRLAFGGRAGLDRAWREHGLDAIVVDVPLRPLSASESARLLVARGVEAALQPEIVAWAQGSPLALTVASTVPTQPLGPTAAVALEVRLTGWLAGRPILDVPSEVLEVAAIAPVVDARLLAAALPARPTRAAMRQLAALPVVERVGDRAMLHAVLAAAIRARLAQTAPARSRLLTRRIVEHLGSRARLGDIQALIELSQFVTDAQLRQAISNQPSPVLYPDRPRSGELATFGRAQGFDRFDDWAELVGWAERGQDYTLVVRRIDGSVVLFGAFVRAVDVPDIGPITASLRLATSHTAADPARSFAGVVLFADASDHDRAEAARLGTGALMHQHGVADMQAVLIHYPEPDRRPLDALAAIAYELPVDLPRKVAFSDFRPYGAVGFVEQIVLGELGIAPRSDDHAALLAVDDDPERQEQLRAVLDRVFGPAPDEQRLRQAIELTHLGPRRSEQECLDALHVSRRTWFRVLRQARERVLAAG